MPVCAKVAPAPRLEITIAKRSKRIGTIFATRDKKSATQLRGEVGRRLVRATSTLNRSHAAHVMGARDASSCQGSESTYCGYWAEDTECAASRVLDDGSAEIGGVPSRIMCAVKLTDFGWSASVRARG